MSSLNRREFVASATVGLAAVPALPLLGWESSALAAANENDAVGPMIGHVDAETANVFYRPEKIGRYTLALEIESGNQPEPSVSGGGSIRKTTQALANRDRCMQWRVNGLRPNTTYRYRILAGERAIVEGEECKFTTAPAIDEPVKTCLAFGSCADNKSNKLWSQMVERGAQGMVLLGDTPYIDSTKLEVQREKHRAFLQIPELAAAMRSTPVWGTWDDHDFGKNNSDGTLPGKENARQAFMEYRANADYGHGDAGIYTSFRRGPLEVFLLDTRWFSRTEPSPVDSKQPTLLGARQWKWLQNGLKRSTAPFKIIACGMIWDDKENRESDDWGTYEYERAALFDFIGKENISGVLLIGGDIHCSRHLKYKTEEQAGYAIHQCIVSPIHNRTISELNVAHPDLVRGEAIPHVWLRLEADATQTPAKLHAEWVQRDGREMWDLALTEDDLRKK